MPNTFGGFPLLDHTFEREGRSRLGRGQIPELDLANSFLCPAGRWPCRGWLLLRRADYDRIDPYSTELELELDDLRNGPLAFGGLTVVQAMCVSRGRAADPNAAYLVEVTDARGVVHNRWFSYPTTNGYNVRAPAYPGEYYSYGLNAGAPWTWDTMVGDLWGQLGAYLGPYPGLPVAPAGTPENYSWPGTSCWLALCQVLDHLGCQVTADLTAEAPYGIVEVGAGDAAFTSLQAGYAGLLEDDLEYIDTGSGRVPKDVVVLFHRRNEMYGTEETVRGDAFQWSGLAEYAVLAGGPAAFAGAAGRHFFWDDFTVRFDADGVPLPADAATALAIATGRVAQYYAAAYRGSLGFMRQTYTGALPFVTGSLVDGVGWRQGGGGWVTEVVRGPQPPWGVVG